MAPQAALLLLLAACAAAARDGTSLQASGQLLASHVPQRSARSLLQVDGGVRPPFGSRPPLCLSACNSGEALNQQDLQCPSGSTGYQTGGSLTCLRNCPAPYSPGPQPGGASQDPTWCLVDVSACPSGWVPYGADNPDDNAITCRRNCPDESFEYLEPRGAPKGCYRKCSPPAEAVTVYSALLRRTVLKCCQPCPADYHIGTPPDRCVSNLLPLVSRPRTCKARQFVAAPIQTFQPYARQVVAPVCAQGWAAFTVDGVRKCWQCSAGTPYQLPSGQLACLCDGRCPAGYLWCSRWWCIRNDRYSNAVLGRLDPKLCGLFLDGLQVQGCAPLCPPSIVVAPPKA